MSGQENDILCDMFTEEEVKGVVFSMEHNSAPGLDGFPAEFYQVFWNVIKGDLLAMFAEFHAGTLPLKSLNFGVITLLPKKADASSIQQYRPICLLIVSFNLFTRVGMRRLTSVADKIIRPTQTAFL